MSTRKPKPRSAPKRETRKSQKQERIEPCVPPWGGCYERPPRRDDDIDAVCQHPDLMKAVIEHVNGAMHRLKQVLTDGPVLIFDVITHLSNDAQREEERFTYAEILAAAHLLGVVETDINNLNSSYAIDELWLWSLPDDQYVQQSGRTWERTKSWYDG